MECLTPVAFMCRNGKYQPMSIMLLVEVSSSFCKQEGITSSSLQGYSSVSGLDRTCVNTFTSDVTKGRLARLQRQGCRRGRSASARYQPDDLGVGIQFPLRNQRDRVGTSDCPGGDRPRLVVDRVCPGRFLPVDDFVPPSAQG